MLETSHHYFHQAADVLGLAPKVRDVLLTPSRTIKVEIVEEADNGELMHFIGYRVQHNNARGVHVIIGYKGGVADFSRSLGLRL